MLGVAIDKHVSLSPPITIVFLIIKVVGNFARVIALSELMVAKKVKIMLKSTKNAIFEKKNLRQASNRGT